MTADFRTWEADNVDGIGAPQNLFKNGKATKHLPIISSTLITDTGNLPATTRRIWYRTDAASSISLTTIDDADVLSGNYSYRLRCNTVNVNGSQFIQTPIFKVPKRSLGKPLTIQLDVADISTFGFFDVCIVRYNSAGVFQEKIAIAGTVGGTSAVPPSAGLSSGISALNGFFIPSNTASDLYAIRYRSLGSTTEFITDNIFIGQQPVRTGGSITDWQTYTPTVQGFGTISSSSFSYRRVGDTMEMQATFLSGTTTAVQPIIFFPPGLTIGATAALAPSPLGEGVLGIGSAPQVKDFKVVGQANDTGVTFSYSDYDLARSPFSPWTSTASEVGPGTRVSFFARIPIANWSSNVTMADRAVEEYAFNTSTATAAGAVDTTSFGYGANGVNFNAIDSATVNSTTQYVVQFQGVIQPTDRITIETQFAGSTLWQPITETVTRVSALMWQNHSYYGVGFRPESSNSIRLFFGNMGRSPQPAAAIGFGAAGDTWAGITGDRWRVRKVSGAGQVGFPVASSNIIYQETLNIITATTTISASPTNVINVCNSGSAFTVSISAIASAPNGTMLKFKNIGAGLVTLDPNGSETIDGQLTWPLSQYSSVDLIAINGAWFVR